MVIAIGKLTVPAAGTPIQVTAQAAYQAALEAAGVSRQFLTVQAVLFQAWEGNTGNVYIGNASMNKTTGAGVMQVLVAPSASSIPSFGAANHLSPAGIDLSTFYLDVETNGEGVLVTVLVT